MSFRNGLVFVLLFLFSTSVKSSDLESRVSSDHGSGEVRDIEIRINADSRRVTEQTNDGVTDDTKVVLAESEGQQDEIDARRAQFVDVTTIIDVMLLIPSDLSSNPSERPSSSPTESPAPSPSPSAFPTESPSGTGKPTPAPSSSPTESPAPSPSPSATPTIRPTQSPSGSPTQSPTRTSKPSTTPSAPPTDLPSDYPTDVPSISPSDSIQPSSSPSSKPSVSPSSQPTSSPSVYPTLSDAPSSGPTESQNPSVSPSAKPSFSPSNSPSQFPTTTPSALPSPFPTMTTEKTKTAHLRVLLVGIQEEMGDLPSQKFETQTMEFIRATMPELEDHGIEILAVNIISQNVQEEKIGEGSNGERNLNEQIEEAGLEVIFRVVGVTTAGKAAEDYDFAAHIVYGFQYHFNAYLQRLFGADPFFEQLPMIVSDLANPDSKDVNHSKFILALVFSVVAFAVAVFASHYAVRKHLHKRQINAQKNALHEAKYDTASSSGCSDREASLEGNVGLQLDVLPGQLSPTVMHMFNRFAGTNDDVEIIYPGPNNGTPSTLENGGMKSPLKKWLTPRMNLFNYGGSDPEETINNNSRADPPEASSALQGYNSVAPSVDPDDRRASTTALPGAPRFSASNKVRPLWFFSVLPNDYIVSPTLVYMLFPATGTEKGDQKENNGSSVDQHWYFFTCQIQTFHFHSLGLGKYGGKHQYFFQQNVWQKELDLGIWSWCA
jgi:hypothetical protein